MGDDKKLDWDEAKAKISDRYEKTETLEFDFGDNTVVAFEVRGLKPDEYDEFEEKAGQMAQQKEIDKHKYQNINFNNEPADKDEAAMVSFTKKFFLKRGIVDGPDGFEPTDEEIEEMPVRIKNTLADAIDNLTNLGIEVKKGF